MPTPIGGGSGKFIFTYRKDEFLKAFPDLKGEINLFIANIDGIDLIPITKGLEDYNYFMDISPDGTKVLVASTANPQNKTANLYVVNLSSLEFEPIKIAEGLPLDPYETNITARWIDDTTIIYIGEGDAGFGIYKINTNDAHLINIYKYNNDGEINKPYEILALNDTQVYWSSLVQPTLKWRGRNYIWWSNLDDSERHPFMRGPEQMFYGGIYGIELKFSPDGTKVAWTEPATKESGPPYNNYLHIALISDIDNPQTMNILTGDVILKWLGDSSKILVFDVSSVWRSEVNKYDNTSDVFGIYILSLSPSLSIKNEHPSEVLDTLISPASRRSGFICKNTLGNLSPDDRITAIPIFVPVNNGCNLSKVILLNLETMTFSELPTVLTPYEVHWIP